MKMQLSDSTLNEFAKQLCDSDLFISQLFTENSIESLDAYVSGVLATMILLGYDEKWVRCDVKTILKKHVNRTN